MRKSAPSFGAQLLANTSIKGRMTFLINVFNYISSDVSSCPDLDNNRPTSVDVLVM